MAGHYTEQQVKDSFWDGGLKGFSIGLALGTLAAGIICYKLFGTTASVPNLAPLIGDIQQVKDDTEGIVYSIISRFNARIISEAQIREGADRYHALSSRFNGIATTLEAMISTGHDEKTINSMMSSLALAQRDYEDFRQWFNALPRELTPLVPRSSKTGEVLYGALPDIAGPVVDLAKHLFDGMKEMDKLKRGHLISLLKTLHFKSWAERPISTGI